MRSSERSREATKKNALFDTRLVYAIFTVVLIYTTPWLMDSFSPTVDTLDTSWQWMLGFDLQHNLQWGIDTVWTYGPLGFLAKNYFYSDHLLWGFSAIFQLVSWIGFGLSFLLILAKLNKENKMLAGTAVAVIFAWVIGASIIDPASQCVLIGMLLLVLGISGKITDNKNIIPLAAAGVLFALGSLIKSTALIMSVFTLCTYPILWRFSAQRKAYWTSIIPFISFIFFYLIFFAVAGQNLSHLPQYIEGTWEMIKGYTPAMSVHGNIVQTIVALTIMVLYSVMLLMLFLKKRRVHLAQGLILGIVLFWSWKEGFTRHDPSAILYGGGHDIIFFGTTLLVSAIGLVLATEFVQINALLIVTGAYLLALIFAIPATSLFTGNELVNYKNFATLLSSRKQRNIEQQKQTDAIRKQFHLDPGLIHSVGDHSVNIIPWNLMMVQSYHLKLVASPVFQAYSVYTPYLDHLNARQIWMDKAASRVIYTFTSIDGRYPAFDEPSTFRALLTCYKMHYPGNTYSVFSRGHCIKPNMVRLGMASHINFNNWVSVPVHGSYASIKVKTSIIGHIANILYKPNQVHILFRLANGSVQGPFRFIYPLGKDRLFMKYFIPGQTELNSLFEGNATGLQKIAAFKVVTSKASLDYSKAIDVAFWRTVPLEHWATSGLLLPNRIGKVVADNTALRNAWAKLSKIYFSRIDLQRAFPVRSPNLDRNILTWAGLNIPKSDGDYGQVRPLQEDFKTILGLLK